MNNAEVEKLLERYRDDLCTEEEKALVESWHFHELSLKNSDVDHAELLDARKQMWSTIKQRTALRSGNQKMIWMKLVAAAVVLLVIGLIISHQFSAWPPNGQLVHKAPQKVIQPGGNKATLILADGSKISLSDASNGVIAEQAGIKITKTSKGELIYTVAAASGNKKEVYNTIQTPRGGQYQINLPDGTRVWLNAESSMRYPATFDPAQRVVELQGEAYFEVAKRLDKNGLKVPFRVKTDLGNGRKQEVNVLGTHFNINAYHNEPGNTTTLLEGSVSIKNLQTNITRMLKPGQQSVINAASASIVVQDVEAGNVIAWKEGFFSFDEENIQTIMNKIARWYDVEIDYRGKKINKTFGGRISRFNSVNEVLDLLQITDAVHFKIEGRRIIVMP